MNTIKDIMSANVQSVRDDWSLEMLSQFFFDKQISGAPVIDANGKLVGVVSLSDLTWNNALPVMHNQESEHDYYKNIHSVSGISREDLSRLKIESESMITVKDIMTPMIFEVSEDAPVQKAAETMLKGHIHRLLVTRGKKLTGIVTTMDMLKIIAHG
ncbi:MAG: CBS domain-containing protein [Gammaproteobacteria bacterium]|nr:CBS domain-containing protein [Gammaproteobacteria bacterium]